MSPFETFLAVLFALVALALALFAALPGKSLRAIGVGAKDPREADDKAPKGSARKAGGKRSR